ncbi:hypothetical protein QO010_000232 [Caulobacter ginsengisoli]|uniref:Uncharacterized protein n=1 Tax=Caulobacter ginsengisoli TaxID=400775 RepID=A0ABU0IKL0_9CAUL|nr:hypothetical protein [Caulobacter ginsengisoli]MDQ0462484.1 hypothetical protein [Caulobacter ginsengisoli]
MRNLPILSAPVQRARSMRGAAAPAQRADGVEASFVVPFIPFAGVEASFLIFALPFADAAAD